MALCGFNDKMDLGEQQFNEGLVEHGLIHHAGQNGETIDQAIQRELSDMTRMLIELPKIEDASKRLLTEGMVKKTMGFYMIIRRHGIDDYKSVISNINKNYWFGMDNKFYGELQGKPDDMAMLMTYLNTIKI